MFLCLLAWWVQSATSGAAPFVLSYDVTNLGVLSGDDMSWATSVNDRGNVTGLSQNTSTNTSRPFYYSSGMYPILPITPNAVAGQGRGINNFDLVVGWTLEAVGAPMNAFAYAPDVQTSVYPPAGSQSCELEDINDQSEMCGSCSENGLLRAVKFQNGQMQTIGVLPGDTNSIAWGINKHGHVVGISYGGNILQPNAFYWNGAQMQKLSPLGGNYASAFKINENDRIVGFTYTAGDTAVHACVWQGAGTPTDVGTLGGTNSSFLSINNSGHMVGWSELPGSSDHRAMVLFTGASGVVDLNTMIDSSSGWTLQEAWDISDAGHIVGIGTVNGQTRAFLLTPVPPGNVVAYYNFNNDAQGWTWADNLPPFQKVSIGVASEGLYLSPDGSFPGYGFAQSPMIQLSGDKYYRAVFKITSDQTNYDNVPQFRLRISLPDSNLVRLRTITSKKSVPPVAGNIRTYTVDFDTFSAGIVSIFVAIDLTHFDPQNSNQAKIFVKEVYIEQREENF
ncbi:MAG: hypothetical protein Kow0059_10480 [Candidatus Sumerlaeia bacterium]